MSQPFNPGSELKMLGGQLRMGNANPKNTDSNMNRRLQELDAVSTELMAPDISARKKTRPRRQRKVKKTNVHQVSEALLQMSVQPPSQGLPSPILSGMYVNQRFESVAPRPNLAPVPHQYEKTGGQAPTMSKLMKFRLHQNMIEKLKKKCQKHPLAEFMCKLCSYYCDTEAVVEKHISDKKHREELGNHYDWCTIKYLPKPVPAQLEYLSLLVENQAKKCGMTYEDRVQRQAIANHVNSVIEKKLAGCRARLYGSSLNCLGFKTSDVNIDFVVPHDQPPSKLLLVLKDLLAGDARFENVDCDLNADLPGIHFEDKDTKLKCMICLNSNNAYEISKLLSHYESIDKRVKTLASVFRSWASICCVDKVILGSWPTYAYDILLVYYLQQLEVPVLPVLHELVVNPDPNNPNHYLDPDDGLVGYKWESRNTMSTGELWLNLFKFYAKDLAICERVVCIRQLAPLKRCAKKWPGRKMAIEDPITPKRNVSRSIVNIVTFDYILVCFRNTYQYFGTLQTKSGPIFGCIQMPCQDTDLEDILNESYNNMEVKTILQNDPLYSSKPLQGACKNYEYLTILPKFAAQLFKRFNTQNLFYHFNKVSFTKNKALPLVCCICKQEGHVMDKCKAEKLPPLQDLPPMTPAFMDKISRLCEETFDKLLPSTEETKQRENIVRAIQEYLQNYNPMLKLELFGSSCNGFGLHKSDLDICLTFKDNPTGEVRNFANIFDDLVSKLRRNDKLGEVIAITTAKVPIVKFVHLESKLEGDISVYNTLAQRNTKMLRVYAEIDPRVKILGFMFKRFAKLCEICDASRGSLSSYAYTLMVVYFLQRCDPPLVPVLQQLSHPNDTPKPIVVEECNTYFFEDIGKLAHVWPGYNKNKRSVGELWIQLLCFYTEKFDFKTDVIAIRQLETLHRFEKLWNVKSIAIEDPFDLSHNLGAGLSRKMHQFIVNAFRRGRALFGTPTELKPGISLHGYFFDTTRLVDGSPPRDRCCKLCHKIGHMVKECPQKKPDSKKYDDIKHSEKEVYNQRRGMMYRGNYENGSRGGMHRAPNGGERQQQFSSPGASQRGFPSHNPHQAQYEIRYQRQAYDNMFASAQHHANVSSAPGQHHVNTSVLPQHIVIQPQHAPSVSPNWKGPADPRQPRRGYGNYSEQGMPRNYQQFQDGPGQNSYQEDTQGLRVSPPRRGYETPRYGHSFVPSSKYPIGRVYDRPHDEYDLPNQNSGRYQ